MEVKEFSDNQIDELLEFLSKWAPDHPELGGGAIVEWQECLRYVAVHKGKIVGYIAQIPQKFKYGVRGGKKGIEPIGWGVTLVLNTSDNNIRKQAGRLLLSRCEYNAPFLFYAAVGVVPEIEEPYKRRGHSVRRDCSKMYGRFMQPHKALKYMDKSSIYAPVIKVANFVYPSLVANPNTIQLIQKFEPSWDEIWDRILSGQKELYGIRNAEYLNYKLNQPNRHYYSHIHFTDDFSTEIDGYIIFRHAIHRTKDMNLIKICDLVGTKTAKLDLVSFVLKLTHELKAYGIVALGSRGEQKMYRKAGLNISKPYPITMSPHIKAKMHVTFFDSDLDNLW